ncbi:hypothetical protein K7640_23660 [Micromonospora sp. PLK6-60]|uniref:lipopolysaccharide biosynthesis protein n=1 Tax=Micromonospora sp. PLK6-60 TaxID=2873383 RepID=UPI001CA62F55|nr:hypothetical protein [Micromonospora sp. PLK6-60]MBY8874829.1 hypothetical protein [Micromonospora sp. PLK6-60]
MLLSGVLTSVIISRALGPAGRGEYITWQTWVATLGILALGGLPQALVLDRSTPGRHKLRQLLTPLAATFAVALVLVAGLAAMWRPPWIIVVAAMLIAAATQLGSIGPSEAQRMGRMGVEFNLARLAPQVAALLAMAALTLLGTQSTAVWLVSIAGLQTAAVALWVVTHAERGRSSTGASHRRLLGDSLRLAPGGVVTFAQYRLDLLAVTVLFPHELVAFYAVGIAAQSAVMAAGQSQGMHWFARRGRELTDRHLQLRKELRRTSATAAIVAVPLAVSSGLWVSALYGASFLPSVPVVAALCFVGILQSLDYLLVHECLMAGHGVRTSIYRLPSLIAVAAGFGLAHLGDWPIGVVALVPGVGYLLSSTIFFIAARRNPSTTLQSA